MRKIIFIVLVMVLLASVVPVVITPAAAYEKKIPFAGEDNELTKDELVNAILPYMLDEGEYPLDEVGDAAYVYAYWGGKPKTVEDACKVVSTFSRPPERIAALDAQCRVPLQAMKATDNIVCMGSQILDDVLYPAFVGIPTVNYGFTVLDYEALLLSQPDFVILGPGLRPVEHYDRIKEMAPDIAVVRFYLYRSYDKTSYIENLSKLAYLLDGEEEIGEYFDFYEGVMDMIKEETCDLPEENKPRVYYMSAFTSYYGWKDYRKGDTAMIIAAGGDDIFSNVQGTIMSAEEVIRLNPEVIIGQGMYEVGGYAMDDITKLRDMRDEIMNRDELQNVTAVKKGEVYVFPADICCCGAAGGRYFLGIAYFAKCLYPDLDLNPTAFHQEFLTRFQGVDYDLSKHGVFVYHPEHFPEGR